MTTTTPKPKTKKQQQEEIRQEALEKLRARLKPGDTVYTVLRHVSRSGMRRGISVLINDGGEIYPITGWVALACDYRRRDDGSLKVDGGGMDMGFAVVYHLSATLFPDGFECSGAGPERGQCCPSNDHANGDRDYTPHWHRSGAYALRHRWL